MRREKLPVTRACGHMANGYGRCLYGCTPLPQNTQDNPDAAGTCRVCLIGEMQPRGVSHGGVWATCDRPECGTSRWIAT